MTRLLGGFAAGALLLALALPGTASAAEQRTDSKTIKPAGEITEFSSYHRRWHRPRYVRRYYAPRYYQPYAYAPQPYYYGRPYYPRRYYGGPGVSFGFRF